MSFYISCKMGDIVSLEQGLAINKKSKHLLVVTGIPLLRITDMLSQKFIQFIDADKVPNKFITNKNDLIFSRTGQVGLVFRNQIGIIHNNCFRVIPENYIDRGFMYWYLKQPSIINYINTLASGAAQPDLNHDAFKSVPFFYPESMVEQKKIAETLDNYENLIQNNNRRIAILEEMAQKLYREWFVKFRFPGHEDVKMVNSELGKTPTEWEVVALQDVCTRITDGAHKSPKSVDQGYPMASVKDMHDFGFNLEKCRQISQEDFENLVRNDSKVIANDILIAKDGSYLKHTFVVAKDLDVALLSSIAILRPGEAIKPHFLAYCLKSRDVKERMKQCVSGVAIPRIILKDFRQFKIILPPKEIQEKWNQLVEQTVRMCWNLTNKNQNLKQQRDLLLPKLISGKIDV